MRRRDWLALGLEAVKEGGEDAIRLEAITARAGRTRGSFYHHFETHGDFVAGMVALWRARHTEDLIAAAESAPSDAARTRGLNALAATLDHRLDLAIRALASGDAGLAAAVAAVDAARTGYLRTLQADPESDAAGDYAAIEYAAFVGFQTITPEMAPARAEALGALISDMIAAHWNE